MKSFIREIFIWQLILALTLVPFHGGVYASDQNETLDGDHKILIQGESGVEEVDLSIRSAEPTEVEKLGTALDLQTSDLKPSDSLIVNTVGEGSFDDSEVQKKLNLRERLKKVRSKLSVFHHKYIRQNVDAVKDASTRFKNRFFRNGENRWTSIVTRGVASGGSTAVTVWFLSHSVPTTIAAALYAATYSAINMHEISYYKKFISAGKTEFRNFLRVTGVNTVFEAGPAIVLGLHGKLPQVEFISNLGAGLGPVENAVIVGFSAALFVTSIAASGVFGQGQYEYSAFEESDGKKNIDSTETNLAEKVMLISAKKLSDEKEKARVDRMMILGSVVFTAISKMSMGVGDAGALALTGFSWFVGTSRRYLVLRKFYDFRVTKYIKSTFSGCGKKVRGSE